MRTSRSSGPGGQHANVTASRVEAVFDVCSSQALSEEQRQRITARLGPVVRAVAQDTRSQARNRDAGTRAPARPPGERADGAAAATRHEADERVTAEAGRVEATARRAEAPAAPAGALGDGRLGAAALALGRGWRGFGGRLADAAALALRRAGAGVAVLPPVPSAGGVVGAAGVAVLSVSVWVVVVRWRSERSKVVVPPTPRLDGVSFGSGSLPPALTITTISRRKTIPPAAAATSLRRRYTSSGSRPGGRPGPRGGAPPERGGGGRSPAALEDPGGLILH